MKLFPKRRLVYSLLFIVSLVPASRCAAQPIETTTAPKAYHEFEVLSWTLRELEKDKNGAVRYKTKLGSGAGVRLIATVPGNHSAGRFERPKFGKDDPRKHLTMQDITPLARKEFFESLQQRVAASTNKSVLIWIHGTDYHFDETAYRAGQFLHDSGFEGTLVMLSWPSFGEFGKKGYFADVEQANLSVHGLVEFLGELPKTVSDANISILAHSLGCRIACSALTVLRASNEESDPPLLDQLILAAGDIDREAFVRTHSKAIRLSSTRTTVYVSKTDFALKMSRGFNGDRRRLGDAGDQTFELDGFDVVDATNADSKSGPSGFGHMYYIDSPKVMKDIVQTLNGLPIAKRDFPKTENIVLTNKK